jgi:hypothetical protein
MIMDLFRKYPSLIYFDNDIKIPARSVLIS